jgi:hypothetical protein
LQIGFHVVRQPSALKFERLSAVPGRRRSACCSELMCVGFHSSIRMLVLPDQFWPLLDVAVSRKRARRLGSEKPIICRIS